MSEEPGPNILDDTRLTPRLFHVNLHLLDRAHDHVWRDQGWSYEVRAETCAILRKLAVELLLKIYFVRK